MMTEKIEQGRAWKNHQKLLMIFFYFTNSYDLLLISSFELNSLLQIIILLLQVRLSNQMSNFGLAFNSTVWASLASCSEEFCKYDDYNWDWSFQKMLQSCVANSMTAVNLQTSRIVHLGEW